VRAAWLDADSGSLWEHWALLPLLPASWLYGAGAWFHRAVYRSGRRRPLRLPCRVVSVGNLVVGGAGKTPTAAWLAAGLQRRGHKVVLASRGYGRRGSKGVLVVSDGRFVRSHVAQAGDEPLVLAAHAPGVPVLVGRDRALVGWRALSAFGADVLVLDDGFQHHRLHRDVDLPCANRSARFGPLPPWGS
jgi:tetraacyldisaccharide 4'-kinase